ncbi:MAG: hypothetical protein ACOYYF_14365 [Chloroflexota bacterium]|nr:hypothetical protein [Chloroflexota bacterium]MBI5703140.1 hypothetical protein [Chloroflexota bacterium]
MFLKNKLFWIVAIAFGVRLLVGVSLHLGLPLYGHADEDDRAGYVFTDAHIRDNQAWKLASSDRPIWDAFSRKFSSDQYGGLLAFSAFVYRYLSPDAQRPLLLIFFSALAAALGVPFLWMAVEQVFGESAAYAAAWIFALYPESILLGSSAMREPYLLTFSAMALSGFMAWRGAGLSLRGLRDTWRQGATTRPAVRSAWIWLALGLLGMLLVSPAAALAHLVLFAGWVFFMDERRTLSWKPILLFALVFTVGLFVLSASLNRAGQFDASSPLGVVNDWLRLTVKWDIYQLERGSGWVQKLFDEMPEWMRLPFVAVYGVLQPVLPAAVFEPDNRFWQIIYLIRAAGWYALLPALILSFGAGAAQGSGKKRNVILWLALLAWTWILLSALRGGGDTWDNPRYRTILFAWQAVMGGVVWVWWRETRNAWAARTLLCEAVFLLVFTQWYASRYFHWGGQLPFPLMIAVIVILWGIIVGVGWRLDKVRARGRGM